MNRIICRTLLLAAAIFCAGELAAQGMPSIFGKSRQNNMNRSSDIPTTVTAMTMDLDMSKNLATLLGDVFVDDQDMSIRCNKMLIYFEEKEDSKKDRKAGAKKADVKKTDDDDDGTAAGKKQPTKIECFGDVVITAKQKKDAKDQKEQKALAGKAVYDLKKDEITLTEKPVIYDGANKVDGTKIIIIVNEERMIVIRGTASTTEGISGLGGK